MNTDKTHAVTDSHNDHQLERLFRVQLGRLGFDQVDRWSKRRKTDRLSAQVSGTSGIAYAKLIRCGSDSADVIRSYEMVRSIQSLRIPFFRLRIPAIHVLERIANRNVFVVMDYFRGMDFEDRWHETCEGVAGGQAILPTHAGMVIELVRDLSTVSDCMLGHNVSCKIERAADHLKCAKSLVCFACDEGWISTADRIVANQVLDTASESNNARAPFPSNGDFQFRNLVELSPSETGLLDFDRFRFSDFEAEHCVSYQWSLMWNNREWQRLFIQKAREVLDMNKDLFQGNLILKTLAFAHRWQRVHELRRIQIHSFSRILYEYESIWDAM